MAKVLTIPDRWSASDIPDLTGKRFLITGATSGIGLAAATELARRNAQVVITARSEEKAKAAIKKIIINGRSTPGQAQENEGMDGWQQIESILN